jgi:hypothetical protein
MSRNKPSPKSHRRITNVPGYVRNGSIVRGHIRKSNTLPSNYGKPLTMDANAMGSGGYANAESNPMDPSAGQD